MTRTEINPPQNSKIQGSKATIIPQFDGNNSIESVNSNEYDTEDEAFGNPIAANLSPVSGQSIPGQPIRLGVNSNLNQSSNLPLCLVFNARSIFNKSDNLTEILRQIGPDLSIISETFEREGKKIEAILNSRYFKNISFYRKNRSPGGGCSIIYNETRFSVKQLDINSSNEIENCWALFTPKSENNDLLKIRRIAVGSYYVSPRSRHKQEVIEHIISTIHQLRAKYDNEVHFICGGDFNRLDISDILDIYGALKQIVSVKTRKDATLEIVLKDLHTLFHPPTTHSDKTGRDSDHDMVVLAPVCNADYRMQRKKKTVVTRPLPESQIMKFEQSVMFYDWEEQFLGKTVDQKVELFHKVLRTNFSRKIYQNVQPG